MAAFNDSKVLGLSDPHYYDSLFVPRMLIVDGKKVEMKINYNEYSPSPVVFTIQLTYTDTKEVDEDKSLRDYVNVDYILKVIVKGFVGRFYSDIGDFVFIYTETPYDNTVTEYYRIKPRSCLSEYCNTEQGCGCCDPQRN